MASCYRLKERLAKALERLDALKAKRSAVLESLAARDAKKRAPDRTPATPATPRTIGGLMPDPKRGEPAFYPLLREREAAVAKANVLGQAERLFQIAQWLRFAPGARSAARRKLADKFLEAASHPPELGRTDGYAARVAEALRAWIAAVSAPPHERAALYERVVSISREVRTGEPAPPILRVLYINAKECRERLLDMAAALKWDKRPPPPVRILPVPEWVLQPSMYDKNPHAWQIVDAFWPDHEITGWVERREDKAWYVVPYRSAIGFENPRRGYASPEAAAMAWLTATRGEDFAALLSAAKKAERRKAR